MVGENKILKCKKGDCSLKNFCARYTENKIGAFLIPNMELSGNAYYCMEFISITGNNKIKQTIKEFKQNEKNNNTFSNIDGVS